MIDKRILWETIKIVWPVFTVAIISILLVFLVGGCQEAQQSKVWGQGNLPDKWKGFFGDSNAARLDFVQTNAINKQGQAIAELAERVRKMEADPNEGL